MRRRASRLVSGGERAHVHARTRSHCARAQVSRLGEQMERFNPSVLALPTNAGAMPDAMPVRTYIQPVRYTARRCCTMPCDKTASRRGLRHAASQAMCLASAQAPPRSMRRWSHPPNIAESTVRCRLRAQLQRNESTVEFAVPPQREASVSAPTGRGGPGAVPGRSMSISQNQKMLESIARRSVGTHSVGWAVL
jgi:hypothetical protein